MKKPKVMKDPRPLHQQQFENSKKPFKRTKQLVIPVSPSRDRTLAGKARIRARRGSYR